MIRNRIVLGLTLMAVTAGWAATATARDVTIPKGTYLELKSATAFDSNTVKKGDRFTATVARGLWVDDQLAIPAGSAITGEIKAVRSPKDGAKSAAVGVKFKTLAAGGKTYDIEGILVSLKDEERRQMLEQQQKIPTGRHIDVILIGRGTEGNMKADTLVGISGTDRDDLADGWAKDGLGPGIVSVTPGTSLIMQFDSSVTVAGATGTRSAGDRSIFSSTETIKSVQRALKERNYYAGEASGTLDQVTRDGLARFQLDQHQPATGDADAATVTALGVKTAAMGSK